MWTYGTITAPDQTTRDAAQDPEDGTVYRMHNGEIAQTPVTRATAATFQPDRPAPRTCGHEVDDGNRDDPLYAYCGLPPAHAGDHGAWRS